MRTAQGRLLVFDLTADAAPVGGTRADPRPARSPSTAAAPLETA